MEIQKDIELAPMTTFRIGGVARYFVEVANEDELRAALEWARAHEQKFFILAGGSNVLFSDKGFDGLVIKIAIDDVVIEDAHVTAGAGAVLLDVIREAAERGLGGWESMAGIPGTIGGAVRGNAGAFGTEVKDVLVSAKALDVQTGEVRTFGNKYTSQRRSLSERTPSGDGTAESLAVDSTSSSENDCQLNYRQSFFKHNSQWVILSATFALTSGDAAEIHAKIAQTIAEREKRHLQDVRAAGSFFMNPEASPEVIAQFEKEKDTVCRGGRVPAGWLIEKSQMRGKQIGGALCSEQHPNYVVNESGSATADEVIMLASMIKMRVRDRMHVQLNEEVTMAGF